MDDLTWRKSTRSSGNGGDCVEVARVADTLLARDSKDPDGPRLRFTVREWRAFLAAWRG